MPIQPTTPSVSAGAEITTKNPAATPVPVRPVATPSQAVTRVQQPAGVPDLAELEQAVTEIQKAINAQSQSLEFAVDADTDRVVVKVIDQQTKEVLRQIPSEEAIRLAKALDHTSGLLIRQKA